MKKKEKEKRFLPLLLIGAMIVSGISAYFTATDTKTNVFEVGKISIDLLELSWKKEVPTTPNETVAKDPQVLNDGNRDAYVYLTVDVPYANVVTANADGTRNAQAETELFSYTVNEGWIEVGEAEKAESEGVYRHVYAYVGTRDTSVLEVLSPEATTATLFDTITFANVVENEGLELTDLDVVINVYGIETEIIGGEATPKYVWEVITNQVVEAAIVPVTAKNADGEDLNATATNITGKQAEELLASLEISNLATAKDVDALIQIESDDFEGLAETTFDVSKIAKKGDTVVLLHYNEDTKLWEHISSETVDENLEVHADFSSYSPVAFVVYEAGLYDANDVMVASWDELTDTYGLDVEIDYSKTNTEGTAYYVLTNNEELSSGTKMIISGTVTSIGDKAFYGCTGLTDVKIPSSVTSIGQQAFLNCTSLGNITIPDSVQDIDLQAFGECSNLTNVTLGNSVTSIGNGAFRNCKKLANLVIGNSVTSIGEQAFMKCTGLKSVTIPDSVKDIQYQAFYNCSGLTNIDLGSVTSIGSFAFYGCTGLTNITIPDSMTRIEGNVFYGCTGLTNVVIPNSVTHLSYGAFMKCTGLTSISIPESVTYIDSGTFNSCANLTTIYYSGTATGAPWGATNATVIAE